MVLEEALFAKYGGQADLRAVESAACSVTVKSFDHVRLFAQKGRVLDLLLPTAEAANPAPTALWVPAAVDSTGESGEVDRVSALAGHGSGYGL